MVFARYCPRLVEVLAYVKAASNLSSACVCDPPAFDEDKLCRYFRSKIPARRVCRVSDCTNRWLNDSPVHENVAIHVLWWAIPTELRPKLKSYPPKPSVNVNECDLWSLPVLPLAGIYRRNELACLLKCCAGRKRGALLPFRVPFGTRILHFRRDYKFVSFIFVVTVKFASFVGACCL
jgi:hypothetical protein